MTTNILVGGLIAYAVATGFVYLTLNALAPRAPKLYPLIVGLAWPIFVLGVVMLPFSDRLRTYLSNQASQPELLELREENAHLKMLLSMPMIPLTIVSPGENFTLTKDTNKPSA